VYEPGPTRLGSVEVGPEGTTVVGSIGLEIVVGEVLGLVVGSMGLGINPTSLGASRKGIRSKVG
jgi:hypothetical protein